MKHQVNVFLVLGAVLAAAGPAAAAHQPMTMGAQAFELAGNGVHQIPAFCRDHDLVVPGARILLGNVAGAAIEVCSGGSGCLPLTEAISRGWILVRGTGDYHVAFENLTKGPLSVKVGEGAIVSDAPVKDTRRIPFELPVDRHEPFSQYRVWRALGQVGAIRFVTIVERRGRFGMVGQDKVAASPAIVVEGIAEQDLGKTISKLELGSQVAFVIDADLDSGKVRALLQDVRLQAAKGGLIAVIHPDAPELAALSKLGDVKVSAKAVDITMHGRRIEGSLELGSTTAPGLVVSARAIVEFHRPPTPSLRAGVGDAVRRGVARIRGRKPASLFQTATDVRDAVRDEVRALRALRGTLSTPSSSVSEDDVWVLIGNERGGVLVLIELPEAMWEG